MRFFGPYLLQRVVISSGNSHNVEIWLRIDQRSDALTQDAIVFNEEDPDPFQAIYLSLVQKRTTTPVCNVQNNIRILVSFGNLMPAVRGGARGTNCHGPCREGSQNLCRRFLDSSCYLP